MMSHERRNFYYLQVCQLPSAASGQSVQQTLREPRPETKNITTILNEAAGSY